MIFNNNGISNVLNRLNMLKCVKIIVAPKD